MALTGLAMLAACGVIAVAVSRSTRPRLAMLLGFLAVVLVGAAAGPHSRNAVIEVLCIGIGGVVVMLGFTIASMRSLAAHERVEVSATNVPVRLRDGVDVARSLGFRPGSPCYSTYGIGKQDTAALVDDVGSVLGLELVRRLAVATIHTHLDDGSILVTSTVPRGGPPWVRSVAMVRRAPLGALMDAHRSVVSAAVEAGAVVDRVAPEDVAVVLAATFRRDLDWYLEKPFRRTVRSLLSSIAMGFWSADSLAPWERDEATSD